MSGVVSLIGAGPGSPDLLSMRGLRLLRRADLIVMDTLLPETYLHELGVIGKVVLRPEHDRDHGRQREINRLMVEAAQRGSRVARLKGGEPFLFGRGWEEIRYLDAHGVPWEVVPGISSTVAAPASASIPLTTRLTSRSVAFVTARLAGGGANRDMPRADTIVLMMGMKVLGDLAKNLMDEGWEPDTPACVIERGCQPGERHVRAPLGKIADAVEAAGLGPPGLVVVGAGVGRADLEHPHPTVLFTGLDPAPYRMLGEVLHWPLFVRQPARISAREMDAAMAHLQAAPGGAILFAEAAAVGLFLEHLRALAADSRALASTTLVAASDEVASTLRDYKLTADHVCAAPSARAIVEALTTRLVGPRNLVLVGGNPVIDRWSKALAPTDVSTHSLAIYQQLPGPLAGRPLPDSDVICFASPDEVVSFRAHYGENLGKRAAWAVTDEVVVELDAMGIEASIVRLP